MNDSPERIERRWYCLIGDKEVGPITSKQLKKLAGAGTLEPGHAVRLADQKAWRLARSVPGLFDPPKPKASPKKTKRVWISARVSSFALLGLSLATLLVLFYGYKMIDRSMERRAEERAMAWTHDRGDYVTQLRWEASGTGEWRRWFWRMAPIFRPPHPVDTPINLKSRGEKPSLLLGNRKVDGRWGSSEVTWSGTFEQVRDDGKLVLKFDGVGIVSEEYRAALREIPRWRAVAPGTAVRFSGTLTFPVTIMKIDDRVVSERVEMLVFDIRLLEPEVTPDPVALAAVAATEAVRRLGADEANDETPVPDGLDAAMLRQIIDGEPGQVHPIIRTFCYSNQKTPVERERDQLGAVRALAGNEQIGPEDIPRLVTLYYGNRTPALSRASSRALERIKSPEAALALFKRYRGMAPAAAAEQLVRLGALDRLSFFLGEIEDLTARGAYAGQDDGRLAAAIRVAALGGEAAGAVVPSLDRIVRAGDATPEVKRAAALALAELGYAPELAFELVGSASSEQWGALAPLIATLGEDRSQAAAVVELLLKISRDDHDPDAQLAAIDALRRLAPTGDTTLDFRIVRELFDLGRLRWAQNWERGVPEKEPVREAAQKAILEIESPVTTLTLLQAAQQSESGSPCVGMFVEVGARYYPSYVWAIYRGEVTRLQSHDLFQLPRVSPYDDENEPKLGPAVRLWAAQALARLGPEAIEVAPFLVESLRTATDLGPTAGTSLQLQLVEALGALGVDDPAVCAVLEPYASGPDSTLSKAARESLARVKGLD